MQNDQHTKIPRRCIHCEFWKADPAGEIGTDQIGTCHVDPPQVVIRGGEALAIHPHTTSLDWCGKWRLRVDA